MHSLLDNSFSYELQTELNLVQFVNSPKSAKSKKLSATGGLSGRSDAMKTSKTPRSSAAKDGASLYIP